MERSMRVGLGLFLVVASGCAGSASLTARATLPRPVVAVTVAASAAPAPPPEAPPVEAVLRGDHIEIAHQIQFDLDSDHIREAESAAILRDVVAVLRAHPEVRRLRVEGHTDDRGPAAHNRTLSQRRAEAVAAYLRGHGVTEVQLEAAGYGPSRPLCRDAGEACWSRNRRVEFVIVGEAGAQATASATH